MCVPYTGDTIYSYVIHFQFTKEYFMNYEISFCHSMNFNSQWHVQYLLLRILKKPEEFQIVIPTTLVATSGTGDLNSNGDIMKQNSNHTS
jgi:hypothetical protein